MLPAYRRIFMRLFARVPPSGEASVAAALRAELAPFGRVEVTALGRYWKIPADAEFSVELEPSARVAQGLAAIIAIAPDGWRAEHEVWLRARDSFLHPAVNWYSLSGSEASRPPGLTEGDVVVIRDCPAARENGLVGRAAVVGGAYAGDPQWSYFVMPIGDDMGIQLAEDELEPAGPGTSI